MEDQGVQSPQTFLVKNISSYNCRENMTIRALSVTPNVSRSVLSVILEN